MTFSSVRLPKVLEVVPIHSHLTERKGCDPLSLKDGCPDREKSCKYLLNFANSSYQICLKNGHVVGDKIFTYSYAVGNVVKAC